MRILLGAALASTPAAAQNVYFGNVRAHTFYNDGRSTPDDAYARGAATPEPLLTIHLAQYGRGELSRRGSTYDYR